MRALGFLVLFFTAFAYPAAAGDGVREINATCALQTGCFPGDLAGLSVTILSKGGYRLTSNLQVGSPATHAIEVFTDDVEIDFAGFGIHGPVSCTGSPLTCTPNTGSGHGIQMAGTLRGLSVHDGAITGMGGSGLSIGEQSIVTNMRLRENRIYGVTAGTGSVIRGNAIQANGTVGIFGASSSVVEGNTVLRTGFIGIQTGSGVLITGNVIRENEGNGISASQGSTISNNSIFANEADGVFASLGCLVQGNTVYGNTGRGLNLATNAGYRENVVHANSAGTVLGGVNLGNNACNGTATCP